MRTVLLSTSFSLIVPLLLCPGLTRTARAEKAFASDVNPALHEHMERQSRVFRVLHAAPFGIGIDVSYKDADAKALIDQFLDQSSDDFETVTGKHPFEILEGYSGPQGIGLRGGGAAAATAFRYMVLKEEGADAATLAEAREEVVRLLKTLHVVVAITGVPGRVARGVQRLLPEDPNDPPIPLSDHREPVPLFDDDGNPLPPEKNNGTPRADNSGGELPEGHWSWEDSCSRDQLVGWVMAMAVAFDAAYGDPDIDQSLVEQLQADAAAVSAMLREKHPFQTLAGTTEEFDLVIMDADGRPTQHHDLHPSGLDGYWLPSDAGEANVFNVIMALAILKGLHHVAGDLEAERFLYEELMWKRGYLGFIPDASNAAEANFLWAAQKTNFSAVNMIAISLFLAIYYETDPEPLAAMRGYLEDIFWNLPGEPRSAKNLMQPYFHAIYLMSTEKGTDPTLVQETADVLQQFPLGPYTNGMRINCDEAELEAQSCLAIDGVTTITVDDETGRGGHEIGIVPLPPTIRPPSNFDARSDPFRVNGGGTEQQMLPAGDLVSAYWMMRWLDIQPAGTGARSPNARTHIPIAEYEEPMPPADDPPTGAEFTGAETGAEMGAEMGAVVEEPVTGAELDSPDAGQPTAPTSGSDDEGGCQVGDQGSNPAPLLVLMLLALLTLRRRSLHPTR